MKIQWTIILIAAVLAITGCDCEDGENACTNSKITRIASTIHCGWSAIHDSLTLTSRGAVYNYICDGPNTTHKDLTCSEWSQISSSFDLDEFNALDLHSCSLCVDGCDISISVTTASAYHRIVIPYFMDSSEVPEEIRGLYEEIKNVHDDLRGSACEQ